MASSKPKNPTDSSPSESTNAGTRPLIVFQMMYTRSTYVSYSSLRAFSTSFPSPEVQNVCHTVSISSGVRCLTERFKFVLQFGAFFGICYPFYHVCFTCVKSNCLVCAFWGNFWMLR